MIDRNLKCIEGSMYGHIPASGLESFGDKPDMFCYFSDPFIYLEIVPKFLL